MAASESGEHNGESQNNIIPSVFQYCLPARENIIFEIDTFVRIYVTKIVNNHWDVHIDEYEIIRIFRFLFPKKRTEDYNQQVQDIQKYGYKPIVYHDYGNDNDHQSENYISYSKQDFIGYLSGQYRAIKGEAGARTKEQQLFEEGCVLLGLICKPSWYDSAENDNLLSGFKAAAQKTQDHEHFVTEFIRRTSLNTLLSGKERKQMIHLMLYLKLKFAENADRPEADDAIFTKTSDIDAGNNLKLTRIDELWNPALLDPDVDMDNLVECHVCQQAKEDVAVHVRSIEMLKFLAKNFLNANVDSDEANFCQEIKETREYRANIIKVGQRSYATREMLGSGAFSEVRCAIDQVSERTVACKITYLVGDEGEQKHTLEHAQDEIKAMRLIRHLNVVRLIGYDLNTIVNNRRAIVCIQSLAPNGELWHYLMKQPVFSVEIANGLFHQLIAGLSAIHHFKITHRDLKPSNILFDEQFNLKITDFGFAKNLKKRLRTELGTKGFMAPEIYRKSRKTDVYDGKKIDIFASGVILFLIICGFAPFTIAQDDDWWFNKLRTRRYDLFWRAHERTHKFGDPTKKIVLGMLHPTPKYRWNLKKIVQSEFYNGPCATKEEVGIELANRRANKAQEQNKKVMRAVSPITDIYGMKDVDFLQVKDVDLIPIPESNSEEEEVDEKKVHFEARQLNFQPEEKVEKKATDDLDSSQKRDLFNEIEQIKMKSDVWTDDSFLELHTNLSAKWGDPCLLRNINERSIKSLIDPNYHDQELFWMLVKNTRGALDFLIEMKQNGHIFTDNWTEVIKELPKATRKIEIQNLLNLSESHAEAFLSYNIRLPEPFIYHEDAFALARQMDVYPLPMYQNVNLTSINVFQIKASFGIIFLSLWSDLLKQGYELVPENSKQFKHPNDLVCEFLHESLNQNDLLCLRQLIEKAEELDMSAAFYPDYRMAKEKHVDSSEFCELQKDIHTSMMRYETLVKNMQSILSRAKNLNYNHNNVTNLETTLDSLKNSALIWESPSQLLQDFYDRLQEITPSNKVVQEVPQKRQRQRQEINLLATPEKRGPVKSTMSQFWQESDENSNLLEIEIEDDGTYIDPETMTEEEMEEEEENEEDLQEIIENKSDVFHFKYPFQKDDAIITTNNIVLYNIENNSPIEIMPWVVLIIQAIHREGSEIIKIMVYSYDCTLKGRTYYILKNDFKNVKSFGCTLESLTGVPIMPLAFQKLGAQNRNVVFQYLRRFDTSTIFHKRNGSSFFEEQGVNFTEKELEQILQCFYSDDKYQKNYNRGHKGKDMPVKVAELSSEDFKQLVNYFKQFSSAEEFLEADTTIENWSETELISTLDWFFGDHQVPQWLIYRTQKDRQKIFDVFKKDFHTVDLFFNNQKEVCAFKHNLNLTSNDLLEFVMWYYNCDKTLETEICIDENSIYLIYHFCEAICYPNEDMGGELCMSDIYGMELRKLIVQIEVNESHEKEEQNVISIKNLTPQYRGRFLRELKNITMGEGNIAALLHLPEFQKINFPPDDEFFQNMTIPEEEKEKTTERVVAYN